MGFLLLHVGPNFEQLQILYRDVLNPLRQDALTQDAARRVYELCEDVETRRQVCIIAERCPRRGSGRPARVGAERWPRSAKSWDNMANQMPPTPAESNRMRVFLCHASGDKPVVRELYEVLRRDGFDPWLDEEDLLPGQDWEAEIKRAVRSAAAVVVFLSQSAVTKKGFVQKEIGFALDVADEQPPDTVFIIPVKIGECTVPERMARWHWVNLLTSDGPGYKKLTKALSKCAESLGVNIQPAKYDPGKIRRVFVDALRGRNISLDVAFTYHDLREVASKSPIEVAYAFLVCCRLERQSDDALLKYYAIREIENALTGGLTSNAFLHKHLRDEDIAKAARQYFIVEEYGVNNVPFATIVANVRSSDPLSPP